MDTEYLNSCIQNIQVRNLPNEDVEVINNSPLPMIGKGRQGAVFRFSDDICVKVFGNTEDCDREHYALSLGQQTNLFPKLYAKGPLHIAMEIINGVDLREYLQSQPLTEELSMKLIQMLVTFKEIGYERIDHHKRQIYLQADGSLKVIDVARTIWRDRVYPYPRKLLNSLGDENKAIFLTHVQALSPQLYKEWVYYLEMEELSRQILQVLLTEPISHKKLKPLSDKLLTPKKMDIQSQQLENLVYKVFKDEWVKVMLAHGYDIEMVKEEIDAYWESHESIKSVEGSTPTPIESSTEHSYSSYREEINKSSDYKGYSKKEKKEIIDKKDNKEKKEKKKKKNKKKKKK